MKLSLKQKIVRTKPGWWKPSLSCSVIDDARRFDHQHDKHVHEAVSALRGAQATPADVPITKEFATALLAVQRERLVGQRQGLGGDFGTKAIKKDDGGRKRWRSAVVAVTAEKPKAEESSIWQPRAKQSDSKSIFDSQECMERAFNCDWERALHYGIGEYVRKNHDDNDAGEVEKVRRCLLSNVWLVYSAFDYLASLGSGGINAINSNAFLSFIKEAKLVDPASTNCKAAHLDQLFVLINSLEPPSERRIALQKAWPDESTMKAAGHDDALEYLVWARANNANALTVLIKERAVPWHQPPAIPPCECVRHLVKGLIRRCEKGAEVEPNGKVTLQEARKFRKTVLGIKRG
ncbi:flagellar associated protein [Chrysochromulina tobinii]|uniref:Flagellar associated protein n=1 Tax=Chrysochromulina tobinii TaxID=1460289 RepID=A0A0M0LRE3_9EUKA|nr:flagellar associated protein [Chrysochromulina tobinii]|eukprot:KOO53556.1 flagellar associated protein [Chrysochromulina sp. CCMP291]